MLQRNAPSKYTSQMLFGGRLTGHMNSRQNSESRGASFDALFAVLAKNPCQKGSCRNDLSVSLNETHHSPMPALQHKFKQLRKSKILIDNSTLEPRVLRES